MVKVTIGTDYNPYIGLQKTLKNIGVTFGLPALLFFLNSANQWMPSEWLVVATPFISAGSYFLKNYIENH
jgi:hypothetical protein